MQGNCKSAQCWTAPECQVQLIQHTWWASHGQYKKQVPTHGEHIIEIPLPGAKIFEMYDYPENVAKNSTTT